MTGKAHSLILFFLAFLISCSSANRRLASVADHKVPAAEELYLKGKVELKPRSFHPFDEDHFGEAIDLRTRRPIVNLQRTVFAEKYAKAGYSLIGNFHHLDKFWIVRVPTVGVEKVFMHFSYFPPIILKQYIAAHSYLRFQFKKETPIEIVAPMPTMKKLNELRAAHPEDRLSLLPEVLPAGPETQLHNVAITAEAQPTLVDPKPDYDLIRGKNNAYVQVTRFISMHERAWDFLSSGNPLVQYEIVGIPHPDSVLKESFSLSQREGIKTRYDLLGHNCTTTAFNILEASTGVHDQAFLPLVKWMQKRVPSLSAPKVERVGGKNKMYGIDDPSLRKEWLDVYEQKFVTEKRPACTSAMVPQHCTNVQNALKKIQGWHR